MHSKKQAQRKYYALLGEFKDIKVSETKSGGKASSNNFHYYEEFDSKCGSDANVIPVNPVSSIKPRSSKKCKKMDINQDDTAIVMNFKEKGVPTASTSTPKKREPLPEPSNVRVKKTRSNDEKIFEFIDKKYSSLEKSMATSTASMIQAFGTIMTTAAEKLVSADGKGKKKKHYSESDSD